MESTLLCSGVMMGALSSIKSLQRLATSSTLGLTLFLVHPQQYCGIIMWPRECLWGFWGETIQGPVSMFAFDLKNQVLLRVCPNVWPVSTNRAGFVKGSFFGPSTSIRGIRNYLVSFDYDSCQVHNFTEARQASSSFFQIRQEQQGDDYVVFYYDLFPALSVCVDTASNGARIHRHTILPLPNNDYGLMALLVRG